jgi:hypothetical protein
MSARLLQDFAYEGWGTRVGGRRFIVLGLEQYQAKVIRMVIMI